MIRFISVAVFVVLFLILSIPLMIAEWIIGKFNMDVKNRSSLAIVNWAFRWCLRLSGVKITYIGEERVPRDQAVLYIGNHRSYFDILMTYVRVPRPTGYVAKIEMLKIPLLSNWMKNLHCLFLDRNDLKQGAKIILTAIGKLRTAFPSAFSRKAPATRFPTLFCLSMQEASKLPRNPAVPSSLLL